MSPQKVPWLAAGNSQISWSLPRPLSFLLIWKLSSRGMPHHPTPDAACLVGCLHTIPPPICWVDDGVSSHWQLCGTPQKLSCVAHVIPLTHSLLIRCFVLFTPFCLHDRELLPSFQLFPDPFQDETTVDHSRLVVRSNHAFLWCPCFCI